MSHQPNILRVMANQLAAPALSIYGNEVCKTPNLDRVAARHDDTTRLA
jgi:choline-sulfatase